MYVYHVLYKWYIIYTSILKYVYHVLYIWYSILYHALYIMIKAFWVPWPKLEPQADLNKMRDPYIWRICLYVLLPYLFYMYMLPYLITVCACVVGSLQHLFCCRRVSNLDGSFSDQWLSKQSIFHRRMS